jgi:hypothetical protein
VPARTGAAATASTNIGNMLGNVLLQPGIGMLLAGTGRGRRRMARIYSAGAFQTGFLPVAAWAIVPVVLIGLTRETHCKQSA